MEREFGRTITFAEAQKAAEAWLFQLVEKSLLENNGKPSKQNIDEINKLITKYQLPYECFSRVINAAFTQWSKAYPYQGRIARLHLWKQHDRCDEMEIRAPNSQELPIDEEDWGEALIRFFIQEQSNLVEFVWDILDRSQGNPTDDDAVAVDRLCKNLQLSRRQSRIIVYGITQQWKKIVATKRKVIALLQDLTS